MNMVCLFSHSVIPKCGAIYHERNISYFMPINNHFPEYGIDLVGVG